MSSYKIKYFKTYFWSGLSVLLNFLSMFIVAPLTTSMPEAFGVYSICVSFTIFLNYADLGFITAGQKYAAEAFSINNTIKEKKYVGTSIAIYGIMSFLFFVLALFFSAYPHYLIKDIEKGPYYSIAHQLLLILAFTIPLSVIQKFCRLIYSVRIEDYRIQSILIIGSLLKIASVPLYFFNERYDIVGYYLFCELINLLAFLYILWNSKKIGYGISTFLNCLRFDKQIFTEIKPLALSGFVSVIGWVTYYEFDTIGISLMFGANAVAIYAVGKHIEVFARSIISILFSPYPVRINYFIGQKDVEGLKNFYYKLVEEFSFVIIPVVTIVLFAKPFVISWVGHDYEDSIIILQFLVLTFILHHVTSQSVSIIYGLNKVKDILKLSVITPLIFWIGVLITFNFFGVECFAFFKFFVSMISGVINCYLVRKYLNYSRKDLYWNLLLKPLLLLSTMCTVYWILTSTLLTGVEKSHQDLLYVIIVMGGSCVFAILGDICLNKSLRYEFKYLLNNFRNRIRYNNEK